MSFKSKLTSKLATLEAARAIFFIVVGLGIKESLQIFSPSSAIRPKNVDLLILFLFLMVGAGYLITAIRIVHRISMLHGHEKWKLENSNLPSSRRISFLSLFTIFLAVSLYLMASDITNFLHYACFTATMLVVNLLLIAFSEAITKPFSPKTLYRWKNTTSGYLPFAALLWIAIDLSLLIIVNWLIIYYYRYGGESYLGSIQLKFLINAFWGAILIFFSVLDYVLNHAFYFGSTSEWQKQKFVYVCSPLSKETKSDDEKERGENISRAQLYCHKLTAKKNITSLINKIPVIRKNITPFAAHSFYTYFLDDKTPKERSIGRQCALAYLAACDAMYVYVPNPEDKGRGNISRGMRHEIKEAKKLGLQIKYKKLIKDTTENDDGQPSGWIAPNWKSPKREESKEKSIEIKIRDTSYPLKWREKKENSVEITIEDKPYLLELQKETGGAKKDNIEFEGNVLRKRVFVCTNLRGKALSWEDILEQLKKENGGVEITAQTFTEDKKNDMAVEALKIRMKENVKKALWQCHDLATDDEVFLAPFAPQAFFTYFWKFGIEMKKDDGKWRMKKPKEKWIVKKPHAWELWFKKSLEVLKVCDAVYIYSDDGLPDYENLSEGMRDVYELAERLGIEIKYKQEKPIEEGWDVALPDF